MILLVSARCQLFFYSASYRSVMYVAQAVQISGWQARTIQQPQGRTTPTSQPSIDKGKRSLRPHRRIFESPARVAVACGRGLYGSGRKLCLTPQSSLGSDSMTQRANFHWQTRVSMLGYSLNNDSRSAFPAPEASAQSFMGWTSHHLGPARSWHPLACHS